MKRVVVPTFASVLFGGSTLGTPARADDAASQCGDNLASASSLVLLTHNDRDTWQQRYAELLTQVNKLQKKNAELEKN